MISHGNLIYSVSAGLRDAPTFDTDDQLCFLPLCHMLERVISVNAPIAAGSTTNLPKAGDGVRQSARGQPADLCRVPRLWEKIYSQVAIRIGDATSLQKWAYGKALKAGKARAKCLAEGKPLPLGTKLAYRFWDFALLQNLRRMIGMDRLRRGGSGGAPISPELLKWYHAIGVPVLEGYGMTESAGVIASTT